MKKAAIALLTAALALVAMAGDVSGKWSGTFTPEGQSASGVLMVLKQSGTTLTGTAGPDDSQQWPISNGKVEGNVLSGTTTSTDGVTYKFTLTADGDRLTGTVEAAVGGQTLKAALDAKRVKP